MRINISIITTWLLLASGGLAQSGGDFAITQSTIAGGGGSSTAVGVFTVTGTAAQANAGGNSSGSFFNVKSGFWTPLLAPTAAHASISGRVTRMDGSGIGHAVLTLTDGKTTVPKIAITNGFGYFRIEDVEVGQTYLLTVSHKRFTFNEPVRVLNVMDDLTDIDFQASP